MGVTLVAEARDATRVWSAGVTQPAAAYDSYPAVREMAEVAARHQLTSQIPLALAITISEVRHPLWTETTD